MVNYKDGKFKGVVNGFHGPISSFVEFENSELKNIDFDCEKTAYVGVLGIENTIRKMKENNTLEVDAVAGATYSSSAFIDATHKAADLASGKYNKEDAENPNVHSSKFKKSETSPKQFTVENTSLAREEVFYEDDLTFNEEYDVVVVGSGGAGMAAAVEASDSNMSVLILEKAGIPGGTTNLSGGVIQASGTKYQKELTKYSDDTPEKHAKLWIKAGENQVDEDLVNDLAKHSAENIEWLAEMGLEWDTIYGHAHIPYINEEYFADRIHQYKDGGGAASGTIMIKALLNQAIKNGVEIKYESPVIQLIQNKKTNQIVGVVAEQNGKEIFIKAKKGVVLATAGIDHNPALAKEMNPQQFFDLENSSVLSAKTNTGDGIIMGLSAGAAPSGHGGAVDFCGKTGNATNNTIPTIPLIFVNGAGKRFVTEDATYAYHYRAIFEQTMQFDQPTYMIFTDTSISEAGSSWTEETLKKDVENGIVLEAATIKELAEKINVPTNALDRSIKVWNENAKNGEDPEYGRIMGVKALSGEKYYAYQNRATNLSSIGGLKINRCCR